MDKWMRPEAAEQASLPVGVERIREAARVLQRYKSGKLALEKRVIASENWWKLRNWQETDPGKQGEPISAWLWNCIAGKHADAMAAYPQPAILPRMADDRETARELSAIVPVVLEQNDFEEVYSDCAWQKLLQGTAVYGVFWEPRLLEGLGDISIRKVDVLNLYWEPGISDLQQSRHLFHTQWMDKETLEEQYPHLAGQLDGKILSPVRYPQEEQEDLSRKALVVDWYYHREGKLHLCKFCGETVLFASENQPEAFPEGWYADGQYPFVMDRLFPVQGSPCGYSYIDVGKSPQESIDLLNQALVRNAVMAATPRYFVRSDGAVNEEEFADWRKPFVHVSGNLGEDSLKQIRMAPIDGAELQILNNKIEELKFTCGNTDVQAGASLSGVTAASAIAALQEAAGRTSRDMSQSAYRAFARLITLVIERIRQFYDWPRQFRILGPMGQENFVAFTNERLRPATSGGEWLRKPVFDVKVSAQRRSSYSRISQNELAIQMMGLGVFDPARAEQALMLLDMMDFDGREELMGKICANAGLQDRLQTYQQMALTLADRHEPQMAPGLQAAARRDQLPVQPVRKPAAPPAQEHPLVERSRQRAEATAIPQE